MRLFAILSLMSALGSAVLPATAGPARQGGTDTNTTQLGREAFSHPSAALDFAARGTFLLGEAVFERPWVVAPSATRAADGLGPYYNARSCAACHPMNGRGHPPDPGEDSLVSMVFALSDATGAPDPVLGRQLQDQAVVGMAAEGRARVSYVPIAFTYPDGTVVELRRPLYATNAALAAGVGLKPRIAPSVIGLGLIEAIAASDILALEDPDDADGDGISGRAHRLDDGALGRFGWKASSASVLDMTAAAFATDIGLSTRLYPAAWGDCTAAQAACRDAPHGDGDGGPEIADALLDLVSYFAANVAVPAQRDQNDPAVQAGEALFHAAGCAGCHLPSHETAADTAPEHRNQTIWPYSDVLLHDLGLDLADPVPTAGAGPAEWRTAPLWGIGLTAAVNGHTNFLHDGRARSLEEAILWHGGEAAAARDAFAGFAARDRAELIRFLESL